MSMHLSMRGLRTHHLLAIAADPDCVKGYIHPDDPPYTAKVAHLLELGAPAASIAAMVPPPADLIASLDLGQTWAALHWLLSEAAGEVSDRGLGWAIMGGREVGADDSDWAYGPPTLLEVADVATIAKELSRLDHESVLGRLVRSSIPADVYLSDEWAHPEGRQWLAEALDNLIAYLEFARANDLGVLRWLR